MIKGGKCI